MCKKTSQKMLYARQILLLFLPNKKSGKHIDHKKKMCYN